MLNYTLICIHLLDRNVLCTSSEPGMVVNTGDHGVTDRVSLHSRHLKSTAGFLTLALCIDVLGQIIFLLWGRVSPPDVLGAWPHLWPLPLSPSETTINILRHCQIPTGRQNQTENPWASGSKKDEEATDLKYVRRKSAISKQKAG